jgi:hypothetical protein
MQTKPIFFSTLYSVSQLGLGLFLHPYQTMQSVVQEKVFVWMALTPTAVLAVATVLWRFGIVPAVRLIFSCQQHSAWVCGWLPFVSNWLVFFCIYWQILLFYLLFRFTLVFGE